MRWVTVGAAVAAAALLVVVPLGYLLYLSVTAGMLGDPSHWTLGNYHTILAEHVYVRVFVRTVVVALETTAAGLVVGVPLAVYISRRGPAARALAGLAVTAPLALNLVVTTFAWIVILQRNGPLNDLLLHMHLLRAPVELLGTRTAALLGLLYLVLPLICLSTLAALDGVDPSLTAAARTLGAGPAQTLARVVLPLASWGIAAGAVLAFATAAGAYLLPEILGGPRSSLLPALIEQQATQTLNLGVAAALSTALMVLLLPMLGLLSRFGLLSVSARAGGRRG